LITSNLNYKTYDTNGSTVAFPIPFQFWADGDIVATLRDNTTLVETVLEITTDYNLSGGSGAVGTLTTTTTYASGSKLLIERQTSQQQTVDLTSTDDFDAESLEDQLDKTVAMVQETSTEGGLAVQGNKFDAETVDFNLPSADAGKAIKWNATATGFENSSVDPDDASDYADAAAASAAAAASSASNASTSETNAAASALAAADSAASVNLPDIESGDAGKILKVKATEDGYELFNLLNIVYPIGSVVTLGVPTNPSTLYGIGTWTQVEGKVIVGLSSGETEFDTLNETGGAKTHTLTISEIPSHRHNLRAGTEVGGVLRAPTSDHNSYTSPGVYTDYQGGDAAHNNLQPYIVKYVWERTA
jgi:microcystin-dependent protein